MEIEAPFGRDFNDLALDKISDGIKGNLLAALKFRESSFPHDGKARPSQKMNSLFFAGKTCIEFSVAVL